MNKIKKTLNTFVCDKETLKTKIDSTILQKKQKHIGIYATIFASVLFIIILGGKAYYNNAVSYVSVDINPRIVLTANAFDKVIKVEGLNDESKTILSELNIKNMDISKAVNLVVDKATEKGYIDINRDDNAILVTTYCDNEVKREKLQARIHNNLDKGMNKNGIKSLIIDQELTSDDAKKANEYNVSEGKMLFVKKALLENPDLKFEDLIYLPTREIVKYISGYNKVNNKEGCRNGNGNGYRNCK